MCVHNNGGTDDTCDGARLPACSVHDHESVPRETAIVNPPVKYLGITTCSQCCGWCRGVSIGLWVLIALGIAAFSAIATLAALTEK